MQQIHGMIAFTEDQGAYLDTQIQTQPSWRGGRLFPFSFSGVRNHPTAQLRKRFFTNIIEL